MATSDSMPKGTYIDERTRDIVFELADGSKVKAKLSGDQNSIRLYKMSMTEASEDIGIFPKSPNMVDIK